jgi:ATP-dependent Clp protease ATP-binding subunit ClpA
MEKIVDKFIDEMKTQLAENKITIKLSASAKNWLAVHGYDKRYGARPLSRLIQIEIKDKLSDEILFGKLNKGGKVSIGLRNDTLSFKYS